MWVEEASSVDISHITRFFTNQQYDKESGLYYYNARYYDPHLGSFLTPDPAMANLNHYAYASANPIRYSDPTGLLDENGDPNCSEDYESGYDAIDTYLGDDNSSDSSSSSSSSSDLDKKVEAFNNWVYENCSNKWQDAIDNDYTGPFNYRGDPAHYNPDTGRIELDQVVLNNDGLWFHVGANTNFISKDEITKLLGKYGNPINTSKNTISTDKWVTKHWDVKNTDKNNYTGLLFDAFKDEYGIANSLMTGSYKALSLQITTYREKGQSMSSDYFILSVWSITEMKNTPGKETAIFNWVPFESNHIDFVYNLLSNNKDFVMEAYKNSQINFFQLVGEMLNY